MTAARQPVTRRAAHAQTVETKRKPLSAAGGVATVDLTAPDSAAALTLPHERDETVGMTGGVPSPRVQQGARDLNRGLKDTSRAVEANETYKRLTK